MLRINIIGAGKVGRSFMRLAAAAPGIELGCVLARDPQHAAEAVAAVGAGRAAAGMAQMRPADLWVLSVPDDRIAGLAGALAEARGAQAGEGPAALHCSGFLSSEVLAPLRARGWSAASCHPVLSFADPALAAAQFPGTCCAIEGDAAASVLAEAMVAAFGGVPFAVDPAGKALYHAAAVFSNNFATVLQAMAQEAWAAAGVPPEIAVCLGRTLLDGTAASVARLGPAAALTGPAARGDAEVLRLQAAAVAQWHPEAAELYAGLSRLAGRLKASGTTLPGPGGTPPDAAPGA
ncbi:Rossmann-like and DUF2520 domain-containing protein [Mangrovicoccus sp. HB161399]|uniref:Rossmann-like and DUF2520 domain-containing protein n=1 Tax=Mangrovicoccus sp. HB161399 TaxID=2720392 RepID=UPI001C13106E